MQHHNNHNLGSKIQAEGMRINAQSKRQRHTTSRRVPSWIKLLVLLAIFVIFFWWIYS